MARHIRTFAMCAAAAAVMSTPALAQSSGGRTFVSVSAGAQAATGRLSDHFEAERNVEQEIVDVTYSLKPSVLFDAGVGFPLWKRLGAGVAASRVTGTYAAGIEASVPQPFQIRQPRADSGTEDGITHAETGVHVHLQYSVVRSGRTAIVLGAGPSWLNVEQELVTAIKYDDTYPYDTATFSSAVTQRFKASKVGFNAGADVRWMLSRSVGLGGLVRFTRANVNLPTQAARTIPITAGGVQAGVGIRMAF
jgi:hypothetical protein